MEALDLYEADLCDGCRLASDIRNDPSNVFRIEHDVCPMCAQMAKAGRVQAATDKRAVDAMGKDPQPSRALPTDGRMTRLLRVLDGDVSTPNDN